MSTMVRVARLAGVSVFVLAGLRGLAALAQTSTPLPAAGSALATPQHTGRARRARRTPGAAAPLAAPWGEHGTDTTRAGSGPIIFVF